MSKFKVGDRVLATDNIGHFNTPMPGTIVRLFRPEPIEGKYDYLVRFDGGEELWSNVTSKIRKKYPVIVITTDGVTTTATKRLGKEVLGVATARLYEDDTFDFDFGAALAMARLVGANIEIRKPEPPKPNFFTGRIVCVDSHTPWWVVGKVYEVCDGYVIDGQGDDRGPFRDVDEMNNQLWAKFIPLVGD